MRLGPSSTEFEPKEQKNPWDQLYCRHCHEPLGFHWQTSNGRIWCLNSSARSQSDAEVKQP